MKTRIFKPLMALVLAFSLLTLPSCTKELKLPPEQEQEQEQIKEEIINLTATNAKKYIGTNLCFEDIYVAQKSSEDSAVISCICYVDVFPIGEYAFEATEITLSLKHDDHKIYTGPSYLWSIYPNHTTPISLAKIAEISITLDKEGNGRASFYLCKGGDPEHPLQSGDWYVEVTKASGTVTEEK